MQYLEQLIDWKTLLSFAAASLLVVLLLPLHKRPLLRDGLRTDAIYVIVNGLIVKLGLILLLAIVVSFGRAFVPHSVATVIAAQPLWLQILEAILVGDFCLYWAHRALHKNEHLWRVHAIHHAVRELDWLAAYHAHAVDDLILSGAAFGSVCLLGFSPEAVAAYVVVYGIFSVAVHVNTRVTIGPLRYVLGSPEFHHWHHSNEADAKDRNFAAIISSWDVLFGTAFLPRHRVPQIYGIDDAVPGGYVEQVFHPFRRRGRGEAAAAPLADLAPPGR